MQVIAKLMIGVSNMFVKYIFGSPCKGHIYRFDSPMTDREIISFGRMLVAQSGIDILLAVCVDEDDVDGILSAVKDFEAVNFDYGDNLFTFSSKAFCISL